MNRKGIVLAVLAFAGLVSFPYIWRTYVAWRYGNHVYAAEAVPPARVAIVFGAAVYRDGRLSPVLRDRVETAVRLYQTGKVQRIVLSGDNQSEDYNEPAAMMAYALARGVPEVALQPDYGGRRTYDTCYRAREVFELDSAILVTQSFHLPRAIFTCRQLGVAAVGAAADLRTYHPRSVAWSRQRELFALVRALWDTQWQRPAPVLGDPIPLSQG